MKKIKTLIYGFGLVNNLLNELEKSELLDIKIEYITNRKNSITHWEYPYLSPNKSPELKYSLPFDLYLKIFYKQFPNFMRNWTRWDSFYGVMSSGMDIFYQFKRVLDDCYSKLIENEIELIIHANFPHEVVDTMYMVLAKELGIKIIFGSPAQYLQKKILLLRENVEDIGKCENQKKHNNIEDFGIEDFLKAREFISKPPADWKNCETFLNSHALDNDNIFKNVNKKKIDEFYKILKHITVNEIPKGIRYAYYPLHYQPEASTISLADSWCEDQTVLIEGIVRQMPDDMYLVVKEHFQQTFHWREPIFYQKLAELKKVIFVSPDLQSTDILKNAEFAVTTTGSVGFEALMMEKPVVYGGYPLYQCIPGAFKFDENFNINDVLNFNCNKEDIKKAFTEFLQTGYEGTNNPYDNGLDCTEEENMQKLVYAYTDYINEIFGNNPNYRENIKNMYKNLEENTKIKENINPEIQENIKNCLPDLSYFNKRRYQDFPDIAYLYKNRKKKSNKYGKISTFIEKNTRSIRKLFNKK